jgi:aerobic carbon-monoxide dehydrogenase medium subunit
MYLPDFNYHKPKSIEEALELINNNPDCALMAGGTDLLVEIKKGLRIHKNIVSVSEIKGMKIISEDQNNIFIGAGVTHNELIISTLIQKYLPVLAEAASKIGSEQVRNAGTIGGNLCTAASCCDTAPVLLALNSSIEIFDNQNARTIPLKDFFVFNKKTILKKGELVSRIIVPKTDTCTGTHYEKFGLREAGSISVVSVAAYLKIQDQICIDACIVIGAVAPTPKISLKSSSIIIGQTLSEFNENSTLLEKAGQAAVDDSIPIDDIRGGAQYRRDVLKVLSQRAILKAINVSQKDKINKKGA